MARIAIIGAGMAGLSAAQRLQEAGHDCTVLEKSRGVGGRMATRRTPNFDFDHGAQYFTARGGRFRAQVRAWQERGVVGEWGAGQIVGRPGMTAPAGALAEPLTVLFNCRVTELKRTAAGWHLQAEPSPEGRGLDAAFDVVLLALPAPQAAELAATAGIDFPELQRVRYAPCIALMVAFDGPLAMTDPSRTCAGDPLAWVARNHTKPGRQARHETVVAHAGAEWSRAHIQDTPEQLAEPLLTALRPLIGPARPIHHQVHRWLYARVEQIAGPACLWDAESRLGACGDWTLGPRVEAAFDSGEALAEAVLQTAPAGKACAR